MSVIGGKLENSADMWKLNNIYLNDQWIKEEIKREIKKNTLRKNKNENNSIPKLKGCCKSSS